jgi:hypothetical protein
MTKEKAQLTALMATTKTIHGVKVWPITQGHKIWLIDIRKNKILTKSQEDEFSQAELAFAFTHDPRDLQKIVGKSADNKIKDFLISTPIATLRALSVYSSDQLLIYIKTLATPKKPTAQASRKPAARARKR